MASRLRVGAPLIDAHSCVDVADLADRMSAILETLGDPGPDPGDGSGVPAEQPYIITVCLTEDFTNGEACGRVVDAEGNIVEGIEKITVPDPTGGALEGTGGPPSGQELGSCFRYVATVTIGEDGQPDIVVVIGSGSGESGGGAVIQEFEVTADFDYDDEEVGAKPLTSGRAINSGAMPVVLLNRDRRWWGLKAYDNLEGEESFGYRFFAQFVSEDMSGVQSWEILSGDFPAPTLLVKRNVQPWLEIDGQYVVDASEEFGSEGFGANGPRGRMPAREDEFHDIKADDPYKIAKGNDSTALFIASWSAVRAKYVIISTQFKKLRPMEWAICTGPVHAYQDIDGFGFDLTLATEQSTEVKVLDFERNANGEYFVPSTRMVVKQIPNPDAPPTQPNPPLVDAVFTALNQTGTSIRATQAEPVIVGGYTEVIESGNAIERYFMITSFPENRAMPGYAIGELPTDEDDPGLQIVYHSGGSRGFKLDSEECQGDDDAGA